LGVWRGGKGVGGEEEMEILRNLACTSFERVLLENDK
jgi:hypothetical protein